MGGARSVEATVRRLPARLDGGPAVTAVAERVLDGLDDLLVKLGDAYQEVAEYAAMGRATLDREVLQGSRGVVEGFFAAVLGGAAPDPETPALADIGRRRLEMGIPLEPMLHVYRIAGRVVWDAIVAATRPGEEAVLAELGRAWMDYIDRAASVAAAGYLAASHERLREVDARRRALLEALLAASDTAEVAAVSLRFDTALAPAYLPVVAAGSVDVDRLLDVAGKGSVGGFRGDRTVVLLPAGPGAPAVEPGAVARAAGSALVAWGRPAAPGPALLREVGHTEELVDAAQRSGRATGTFGPDDLLLEQLLAGNERAARALRDRVAGALTGRDHDGLVTATLRTFLRTGSVPATAAAEVVHSNTVLYRLKRVKALTGLDPRIPAEAALLVLGLTAGATT